MPLVISAVFASANQIRSFYFSAHKLCFCYTFYTRGAPPKRKTTLKIKARDWQRSKNDIVVVRTLVHRRRAVRKMWRGPIFQYHSPPRVFVRVALKMYLSLLYWLRTTLQEFHMYYRQITHLPMRFVCACVWLLVYARTYYTTRLVCARTQTNGIWHLFGPGRNWYEN